VALPQRRVLAAVLGFELVQGQRGLLGECEADEVDRVRDLGVEALIDLRTELAARGGGVHSGECAISGASRAHRGPRRAHLRS
jgi:hypothetical protein